MVTNVFLVCSGLGHVQRGFESFSRECFSELSREPTLDITLLKGGGDSSGKEITLWNVPRSTTIAECLGKLAARAGRLVGRELEEAYFIEQASFFTSLLPHLYSKRPEVVFLSDWQLGYLLAYWKRLTRSTYRILFSNGAPRFKHICLFDHVQQLVPTYIDVGREYGLPQDRQSLVPYGFRIDEQFNLCTSEDRRALRRRLQLPEDRPVLLSVGNIDQSFKRMDYVIREVARLPEPRPYLLLLGQLEQESAEIIQLGNALLGSDGFQTRTVPHTEIPNYYQAGDAFVLASLAEGFGRVFVEAMSYGLPCLAHDYAVPRFILGEEGYYADFESSEGLASLIVRTAGCRNDETTRQRRHRIVYDRFSWEKLRPAYVEMIRRCAVA